MKNATAYALLCIINVIVESIIYGVKSVDHFLYLWWLKLFNKKTIEVPCDITYLLRSASN